MRAKEREKRGGRGERVLRRGGKICFVFSSPSFFFTFLSIFPKKKKNVPRRGRRLFALQMAGRLGPPEHRPGLDAGRGVSCVVRERELEKRRTSMASKKTSIEFFFLFFFSRTLFLLSFSVLQVYLRLARVPLTIQECNSARSGPTGD